MNNLKIFGLGSSRPYANKVCNYLGVERAIHTENYFEDGEGYIKSDENVRDADVYIISSLHSNGTNSRGQIQKINERLVDLLWFIGSLKDASAKNITVVAPYLGYARQDRKTESRAPITTKYMAQVFEAVGVNRVLTIDVHSLAAFQNSFRIPVDNLTATRLFVEYLTGVSCEDSTNSTIAKQNQAFFDLNLAIVSPDHGSVARCALFQKVLRKQMERILGEPVKEIPLGIFDKRRIDGQVEGSQIIGDVKDRDCILLDDMIASGNTIAKAAYAVKSAGGRIHAVLATHGLFTWDAENTMIDITEQLIVTDTVERNSTNDPAIRVIDTSCLIGEAIKRTHLGGSISELLEC